MSRDLLLDDTDPIIRQLRQQVVTIPPHQPKPGDADYQTPEQVARIKRWLQEVAYVGRD